MSNLPALPTLGSDSDSRLAVELAIQIRPIDEIMESYGLTKAELKEKLANPVFKGMVVEAKKTWESDLSVKERIRLKAAHLVEDSILSVFNIIHDKDNPAPQRLDAFKSLTKVADVEATASSGPGVSGEKFTININLGDRSEAVTIDSVTEE